jgi:hypothetical protein
MLVGDVNLQNRDDPAGAFWHVLTTLREAEVLFGQLEGPLSRDPLVPDIPCKVGWCHPEPRMVGEHTVLPYLCLSDWR